MPHHSLTIRNAYSIHTSLFARGMLIVTHNWTTIGALEMAFSELLNFLFTAES